MDNEPTLDELVEKYHEAQRSFRARLVAVGYQAAGTNPAKAIREQIEKMEPGYFARLKELEIEQAITLLKTEGYQVLKRVENVAYEEV